jgi:uncharacterized membrane protein
MKSIGDFLKTTIIGGLFVLLPILLFTMLLDEAIGMLVGLATPLADLFPQETFEKVRFPALAAVTLIAGVSFLFGLVLRASPGKRLLSWIEQNTLGRLPAYTMVRTLTAALLQTSDATAFKPAMLVSEDGTREPAYLVEDHGNGNCTVLLPWAPTPFAGSLKVVPGEMIELLDANLADFTGSSVVSGWDSATCWTRVVAGDPTSANTPGSCDGGATDGAHWRWSFAVCASNDDVQTSSCTDCATKSSLRDKRGFRLESRHSPDKAMTLPSPRSRTGILSATALLAILLLIPWGTSVANESGSEPEQVWIGLKINQITDVNQRAENYTVVGTLRLKWSMARLAFEPAPGENDYRTYEINNFISMLNDKNIPYPEISFYNQQGRSAIQNKILRLDKDGTAQYLERFTSTFQAPDFNFTRFPLDIQRFTVKIDSVFAEDKFLFRELPGVSGMGERLGEEEWVVRNVSTDISTQRETTGLPASRFTLEFTADRHLNYYVLRILVPSLLIVLVGWFSFFLRDFAKRVDLASGNLLLFIAFNFTISNDLPRLGYLTIMDAYLAGLFIITGGAVLGNVLLKRLQQQGGRETLVKRLDAYAIWAYPISYIAVIAGIAFVLA